MAQPLLFSPITIRGTTIRNRVWLSPMCMYSADRNTGLPGPFHRTHYHSRAQGGFGLIITEATAVCPEGRISLNDVGMWSHEHVDAWREVTKSVHREGSKIVVQLGHAGRKAGTYRGFPGEATGLRPAEDGGWTPVAPSGISFAGLHESPRELSTDQIAEIVKEFTAAARRAEDAYFDGIEIHAAHGYLLHQFLSPLSNQRTDSYGGSFENRCRLLVQIVDSVRAQIDDDMLLFVRISATDWLDGGWTLEESVKLANILKSHGVDLVDVSSGGTDLAQQVPVGPGYQVPLAEAIRESRIPVAAVGLITDAAQAEEILRKEKADVVLIGRAALRDPFWPLYAAAELAAPDSVAWPPQYLRGRWT